MTAAEVDLHRELSHDDIERVFATVAIPACPTIVTQVMAEAQKDSPDIRRLAVNIAGDIGMSATAIKMANSPLFRAGAPVTNVRKALERLGMRNVVCVVVATALRTSFDGIAPDFIDRFWSRNAAVALAAGLIARRQYGVSPDSAYTYALFHDAGIPLMIRRFPEYGRVLDGCRETGKLVNRAEETYFPCTHPIVGSLLVRNWGLPSMLGRAIRFHHDPDAYELPDATLPGASLSLIATTHIAEHMLTTLLGERDIEVGEVLFERAIAHLGFSQEDLEQLREDVDQASLELKR